MAKKPETTALTNYDDRLAALAKQSAATEAHVGGGSYISTKNGVLSYNGGVIPDNRMNAIVLNHTCENAFYAGERYDPNNHSSPVCFSFFTDPNDAAPHEKAEDPQCETCAACPHNEFGSADTGRGKACKNIRRLALITEDGMEDIESATVAFLKVPVTSVKEWAGYVNSLNNTLKLPPLGVITEISIVPDQQSQFKLKFKLVEKIEDADVLKALLDKMDASERDLVHPYMPNSERPAPAAPQRGGLKTNARVAAPAGAAKPSPKLNR